VKFAYQWTRKLLVAADLNTATLLGGAPTAFAKLPTEQDRTWFLKGLNKKGGYNVLDVDVDYAFVYAIEPPGAPASWMRIVNEVGWTLSFGAWAGAATTFEPSISTSGIGGVAGALCGTTDGYEYPDYPDNPSSEARPSGSPSGTPVDPYVMGQSRTGCQATTGT
jgi:hypothetical protein